MRTTGHCAIVGLGVTAFGKLPELSARALETEAVRLALVDAGVPKGEVDGLIYVGPYAGGSGVEGEVAQRLGLRPKFIWSMNMGGATAIASVATASWAIEAGLARSVVCVESRKDATGRGLFGAASGPVAKSLSAVYGQISPGADHALAAQRHMHEFGTTSRQLGTIAVIERDYAQHRPEAVMYGRRITLEDHQNSRWIVEPLHLLDYCQVTDGAVAVLVTSAERSGAARHAPVFVRGVGLGHQLRLSYEKGNFSKLDVAPARDAAFRAAGLELADVDVAALYDCFTITVLLQCEGYGWCKPGEGGALFESGATRLEGSIPLNPGGGMLSGWYCEGFTPLSEGIRQIRGEGGETQVPDAEVALVSGHGGTRSGSPMQYGHGTMILGRANGGR